MVYEAMSETIPSRARPEPDDMPRRPKLAEKLANIIAARISDEKLTEGDTLGSEAQLAEALGASRWTVREALGILEGEGMISMRRGRYGGIFVAAPTITTISGAIRSYLEFIRVGVDEIIEARRVLDEAILERALARLQPSDIPSLRDVGDFASSAERLQHGFIQYEALLLAARSPVLFAFVRACGDLGISAILRSTLDDARLENNVRAVRIKRREQIEAIIAGDLSAAVALENAILETSAELLNSAHPAKDADSAAARLRALHLLSTSRRFKRPELLMQEIASDIVGLGWPVGEHLGTETELLARYNVSRTAFREAVRALEQIGVVEMRTGRKFGLKVASPTPDAVVANSRRQFARMGVTRAAYREAFDTVGAAAAGFAAAQHGSGRNFTELASGPSRQFFNALGDASGNRIIALMIRILTGQDRAHGPQGEASSYPIPLPAIAAAIDNGDVALARRHILSLDRYRHNDMTTS